MAGVGDHLRMADTSSPITYSGEIIEQISEVLVSERPDQDRDDVGTSVLRTVNDDSHDIGKDLVNGCFDHEGADVLDLGVDVTRDPFVEAVEEYDPERIAGSGVMTAAFDSMDYTVEALEEADLCELYSREVERIER